ncbi:hypothetical protein CLDAP_13330 [Caldilinea aerophila DSM 14535 = NBRC 104270]|uniref:Uncharacterized protein n=1 Tax=Caldilinea aerophila (strain DSM 14535 / JCM 11387 / NBRC 104270 / STL-6-O1) TaxID=926550 RepID=I0I285_CALAS|nr:hypothetical protein CLDAP_13330 [Caldilinea aerophila DSM 14535 = NBRC 104270]
MAPQIAENFTPTGSNHCFKLTLSSFNPFRLIALQGFIRRRVIHSAAIMPQIVVWAGFAIQSK